MRKLDESKPYGTIWGHATAGYEQDGKLFGFDKVCLEPEKKAETKTKAKSDNMAPPDGTPDPDKVIETDEVDSAKRFLETILANGPLAKATVFGEAQKNNQEWDRVKEAAAILDIRAEKAKGGKPEMWSLPPQEQQ
jgi:hypothetical protein